MGKNLLVGCFASGLVLLTGTATVRAAGLSSQHYVQDGLVAQFDAYENVGVGQYDAAAKKWLDIKGAASISVKSGASWAPRWFDTSSVDHGISGLPPLYPYSITVETAVNVLSNGTRTTGNCWPRIFRANERFDIYYEGSGTTPFLYANGLGTRVSAGTFRDGTIAAVSDTDSFRTYVDGSARNTSGSAKVPTTAPVLANGSTAWNLNGCSGYLHGLYRAVRMYNRALTEPELAQNALIDDLRYFSFQVTGTGVETALPWATAGWSIPWGRSSAEPNATTNDYARVINARVAVSAAAPFALKGLSLEDGSALELQEGALACTKVLYVDGEPVPHGIYTGTGAVGTQVTWLKGTGVLRVAGGLTRGFPVTFASVSEDGWFTVGKTTAEGGSYGFGNGYPGAPNNNYHWIKADWPEWDRYVFPEGTKLRVTGYAILDQIPAAMFDTVDFSQATYLVLHTRNLFADGTRFTIPANVLCRYQPGNWVYATDRYWLRSDGSGSYDGDLTVNGEFKVYGDGTHLARQECAGAFDGTGTIRFQNFSNQLRLRGPSFGFSGTVTGFENAQLLWIDTLTVTGSIPDNVTLSNCGTYYHTNTSYCADGIFFGRHGSGAKANNELYVKSINGQARDITDTAGKRWRCGGLVCVWGSNTVHAGTVSGPLHVVGRRQDQNCNSGFFNSAVCVGPGFLKADTISTDGDLFLSTNIYVTAQNVTGAARFNYTYQSNAVNRATLDISGTCSTSARLYATDLQMLPARVSGFTGTIALRDAAAERFQNATYALAVDFDRPLHTVDGCVGSGTLSAAPALGTVNVTLAGTATRGTYGLFRFDQAVDSEGQSLFKDWKVTFGGQEADTFVYSGGGAAKSIRVIRDAKGLSLKVGDLGGTILVR